MEVGLFPATKINCLSAWIPVFQRIGVTAVKFEIFTMVWLRIQVFQDVMLRHWVNGSWHFKDCDTYILNGKAVQEEQPQRIAWLLKMIRYGMIWYHDASNHQKTLTHWHSVSFQKSWIHQYYTCNAVMRLMLHVQNAILLCTNLSLVWCIFHDCVVFYSDVSY